MRYLCLAYYDAPAFEALTPTEVETIVRACRPHDEAIRRTGRLVASGSLAPPRATTTLRPRPGAPSVTDGPFAETKEQLGGFFIIEAEDRDEALRVAALHPAAQMNAHLGWALEVRPIEVFSTDRLQCRLDPDLAAPAARQGDPA